MTRWENVTGSITTDPGFLKAAVLRIEVSLNDRVYTVTEVISDPRRLHLPDAYRLHLDSMVYDLDHEIALDQSLRSTSVQKKEQ